MTDPVDVLAGDLCCLGPCENPAECSRKIWTRVARAHIRALEQAGFKVIEREPTDAMKRRMLTASLQEMPGDLLDLARDMWDAAPTYGDKT